MKLAIIATLCVGLAVARWHSNEHDEQLYQKTKQQRNIQDTSFKSGREYQYLYNGQVLTGLPGSSSQHAGTRIQAVVVVQFQGQQQVALKLANVRFGKLNARVSNPRRTQPFSLFEEVPLQSELKQQLSKAVIFSYTNGLVHSVHFEDGEQPWSANIKRGILNMLQVNLKEHQRVETEEASLQNTIQKQTFQEVQPGKSRYYRVVEKTLEGECETIYEVGRRPSASQEQTAPVLNVTKSIDFETCQKRPQIKYNWRFAMDCPTCDKKYQEDEKFLKSSSVFKYNITGTRDQFLIETVEVESQYVYAPMQESDSVVDSYVKQRLELAITQQIGHQIQISGRAIQSDSDMLFTLDWDVAREKFLMSGDQKFLQKSPFTQVTDKVAVVSELAKELIQATEDKIQQEAPTLFTRLIQALRLCSRAELEQIHQAVVEGQHFSPEQQKRIQKFLLSANALAGTHDSITHMLQKIRQQKVSPLTANLAIRELANVRVVSEQIIHEMKTFVNEPVVQQSQLLKQASWLALGSLVNALCAPNEDQLAIESKVRSEQLCPSSLKEEIVKLMFQQLKAAQQWEDQLTLIKAISNSGLDIAIFELEKIILSREQQHPTFLRVEAINALQNLRDQMPRKIRKILMPIYMNPRERPEVRVTALYELLNTQPERPILEIIAKNLNNEPSRQVAAFAYGYMNQLANSTNPCFQNMTSDLKLALRFTKQVPTGIQYSRLLHLPMHSENLKMGVDVNIANVMSAMSLVPFHSAITLDSNFLGHWNRYLLTIGASSEGLEPLLYQLMGENGLFSEYSFENMSFKRHPRNTAFPYQSEIQQLFKQLKVQGRQFSTSPKAFAYLKFKGQEMGFIPVSAEKIQRLLQDNSLSLRDLEQKLRQGQEFSLSRATVLQESMFKIPTTLGLPLVFEHRVPLIAAVRGQIQLELKDNSYDRMVLNVDIKPTAAVQSTQSITIWSPVVNSGLKIRSQIRGQLPIKGQIQANTKQTPKQVKIVVQPPKTTKQLLVAETRPITFNMVWPKTASKWIESDEKTVQGEEHNRVNTIEKSLPCQLSGSTLKIQGRWHTTPVARLAGTPLSPFSGPNKLVIQLEPRQTVPEDIEIKLEAQLAQQISEKYVSGLKAFDQFQGSSSSSSSASSSQASQSASQETQKSRSGSKSSSQSRSSSQTRSNSQEQQSRVNHLKIARRNKNRDSSEESFEKQPRSPVRQNQLKITVNAKGTQKQIVLNAIHKYTTDMRYNKLSWKLASSLEQQFEMCLNAEVVYPKTPFTVQEAAMKKVVGQAELKWGQTCQSDKHITLKVQAERSQAQKQYEESQQGQQFSDCRYYESKQLSSPVACYERVAQMAMLKKYTVDIEYNHLPTQVQNVTDKILRYLKYRYYWQADIASINVQNPSNKVQAKIYLDPESMQRVNVTIKTPKQNITVNDIPLPVKVVPISAKRTMASQILGSLTNNKYQDQAVCQVNDYRVRTFDGSRYSAPLSNCWSVLAKDCVENGRFVVMMKKSSKDSQHKQVKILTPRHKILLQQGSNSQIKVQINDQERQINSAEVVQEHGHEVAVIQRQGQYLKINLPEAGVRVYFDGYSCNIKVSPLYMHRQCGLCGHYDSETSFASEFMTPAFQPAKNMRSFMRDYTVQDSQCKPVTSASFEKHSWERSSQASSEQSSSKSSSSSESQSRSRSQEWSSSTSKSQSQSRSKSVEYKKGKSYKTGQQLKPVLKTKTIERLGKTCFSVQQVPKCPKNAFPIKYQQQTVEVQYRCVHNSEPIMNRSSSRSASSSSESQELKTHLQKVPTTFTVQERVPKTCQRH
jgi:phage gp36-like protein